MTLVEKFVVSLRRLENKDVPSGEVWCIEMYRYGHPELFVEGFMGAHSYSDTKEIISRAFYKAMADVERQISRAGMEKIPSARVLSVSSEMMEWQNASISDVKKWMREHGCEEKIPVVDAFAANLKTMTDDELREVLRWMDETKGKNPKNTDHVPEVEYKDGC